MAVDRRSLANVLAQHLANYRETPYAELAARLESGRQRDALDVVEGTAAEGNEYTIETTICWDDRSLGHIRVMADVTSTQRGCLFGFLPIFVSDATDSFIVAPDGTFVGE